MCGIFGYIGKRNNAPDLVLSGIKLLEYRGYDSWGVAFLENKDNSTIQIIKKTGRIGNHSLSTFDNSNFALGHTRWATHGGVNNINAHPHLDCTGQFALIHNGIIENYFEIRKNLIKSGHKFISDTDTEIAIHLIEETYKKLSKREKKSSLKNLQKIFLDAVRLSFNEFTGLSAIIVMDIKSKTFVAAKNGSPLVIGKGINENFLASDAHALLTYTKNVYFMEDNQVVLVSEGNVTGYQLDNGSEIKINTQNIQWKNVKTSKGRFKHFMIKEIYDQPKVIHGIVSVNNAQIEKLAELIKKSYGTFLVGCGTAAYACLAGTYIFSNIAKRHINYSVGSEFGYLVDFLTSKSLVIALSQSGETIDVIESIKKSKEKKASVASLVNVLGSTLYRMSDYKILLGAGVEKAVVSTKAFTAKLTYLYLLSYALVGQTKRGIILLSEAIRAIEKILEVEYLQKIKKLVALISNKKHIYVIGRGLSYPIALETALKIKESSYIHAEGFAAGELKHGVIALIEKKTPCIVFIPNDETYGASLAGAMEMKARGGFIIGISFKNHQVFDFYLPIQDVGVCSALPMIVIGQLLGYYLAIACSIDPDTPRNLAKSVTVK